MVTISVDSTLAHQSFGVLLDGVDLTLDVRWNARAGAWILAVSDADGVILAGRRITSGASLFGRVVSSRLPGGDLMAVDTSGDDTDPGAGELGQRVELVYLTAADVAAIDAEIAS